MGKLLERVVAARINEHLSVVGPNLAEEQFGFRSGRSTVGALLCLKKIAQEAVARGERVLAVSLDIANAFNSLPYECIEEALRYHAVPLYLRRLVGDYLRDRDVLYLDEGGRICAKRMMAGVPQGSVMGPLLWNIGYNWVLRGTLLPRTNIICYADDTLFIARGNNYVEVAHLASVGATMLVGRIRSLGLQVAVAKTEALMFYGRGGRPPPGAYVLVDNVQVKIATNMKYLGLVLDSAWKFSDHFRLLAPKIHGAAGALARLLSNLGGPNAPCRYLYAGVIRSMALYGAPVWVDALNASNRALLQKPQRIMAIRAVRGYRTMSHGAACVIAGSMPWEKEAKVLADIYRLKEEKLAEGYRLAPQEVLMQENKREM